jgi:adenine-specific DNA-methyltransferase
MSDFSSISKELSSSISKEERKKQGIFFTPKNVRDLVISKIDEHISKPKHILEPSFGSGEFLKDVQKYDCKVTGVEFNKIIFDKVSKEYKKNNIYNLVNTDFIKFSHDEKFDVILGNPPYFVTDDKNTECMTGRGNIFVMFIYKCLTEHLQKDGLLVFVLPTSFYNCKYYEPCRKYIREYTTILHVENVKAKYIDTSQDTMVLVIKNTPSQLKDYIIDFSSNICISPYQKRLKELMEESTTLEDLECNVKTGEVVWNQHKDKLDDEEGTLLIYSSNIIDNKLIFNNLLGDEKKQYIKDYKRKPSKGPAILVSRGYGNKYSFSYAVVDKGMEFYGENHINIITPKNNYCLNTILKSFKDERTEEFIKLYTGNGALSKTEIETILPIFY